MPAEIDENPNIIQNANQSGELIASIACRINHRINQMKNLVATAISQGISHERKIDDAGHL